MLLSDIRGQARPMKRRVGAAARSISLRMMSAMIVITGIGAMMLVAGVILGSRHEFSELGLNPNSVNSTADLGGTMVIDSRHAVIFIALFAAGIIIATGAVGWFFSRQEIRPIEKAMRLQRNFVADASHELKTPLSIIAARIELLNRHAHAGKSIDKELADLRDDVTRMNDVINDLLSAIQNSSHPVPVAVTSAIQGAVSSISVLAAARHVRITVTAANKELFVLGGKTGIERCLVAVLDNGITHSPEGSTIEVGSESGHGHATITIRDHGSGISGDPERLFSRFEQGHPASTKDSEAPGSHPHAHTYGLGLALVRDILTRYNGAIALKAMDTGGTLVTITLPKADVGSNRV